MQLIIQLISQHTDGPNRLIRDDQARPVARPGRDGLELRHEHVHSRAGLAVLLVLAAARHDRHADLLRMRDLGLQQLVRLAEEVAALRVAHERPRDARVRQHLRRHLASVRPLGLLPQVLRAGLVWSRQCLVDLVQVQHRRRAEHLHAAGRRRAGVQPGHQRLDVALRRAVSGVALPVAADDGRARRGAARRREQAQGGAAGAGRREHRWNRT